MVSATKKSSCVAERLKATHRCGLSADNITTLFASVRSGSIDAGALAAPSAAPPLLLLPPPTPNRSSHVPAPLGGCAAPASAAAPPAEPSAVWPEAEPPFEPTGAALAPPLAPAATAMSAPPLAAAEALAAEAPPEVPQSTRRSRRPGREACAGGHGGSDGGGPPEPSAGSAKCGVRFVCQRQRKMRRPEVTANSSPEEWKAMHETTKSKSRVRTHCSVRRSQMRTVSSSDPDARTCLSRGWNLMVHGVRRWPRSVQKSCHEAQRKTLTVWSPCVLAKSTPSVLKASAIVDFASGFSLQYAEDLIGRSSHSPAAQRRNCMSRLVEGARSANAGGRSGGVSKRAPRAQRAFQAVSHAPRSASMCSKDLWRDLLRGPYMVARRGRGVDEVRRHAVRASHRPHALSIEELPGGGEQ